MKERSKDGKFVKRLQYILLFATMFSFGYLLAIINIVEPIYNPRETKSVAANSTKPEVNSSTSEKEADFSDGSFLQPSPENIAWDFKVENIEGEIGADLQSNSTPPNAESHVSEDAALPEVEKTPDFVMPLPQDLSEDIHSDDTDISSVKIEPFKPKSLNKIDWHDYERIEYERGRQGVGEQGKPVIPELDISKLFIPGYSEHLGDRVALNRSIPDTRPKKCSKKLYLESLPSVSVVIPFHNEHLSTLLRTIYSVVNRSPEQLLKEVFVVDDGNNEWDKRAEFYDYMRRYLPEVKTISLRKTSGLMAAQMAGVRAATGDVVVVLDSHTEANVNWLPPLLEPIALDYRTVVLPQVDPIESVNLQYNTQDSGRGVFDWELRYHRLPLPPRDKKKLPEPYETPVMSGGLFAISRAFFLELGGYDPGLKVWAGEQYELSFKIWQCGGRMLEAPCSRVGHVNKIKPYSSASFSRNILRVAQVWMDEYAQYLYQRKPDLLTINPGDLEQQKAWRERLHCKPFRWYMERVAYDIPNKFPMVEPAPFAEGRIRPIDKPKLCADAHSAQDGGAVMLKKCQDDNTEQQFVFSWQRNIRLNGSSFCWNVPDPAVFEDSVYMQVCNDESSQKWKYRPESRRITFGGYDTLCLERQRRSLFLNHCSDSNSNQGWLVDHVDYERIKHWGDTTETITGPINL